MIKYNDTIHFTINLLISVNIIFYMIYYKLIIVRPLKKLKYIVFQLWSESNE